MSARHGLYRAVLAAPADDLPRLVLADHLDESGEPDRAAFVRAQVDLARDPADLDAYLAATAVVAAVVNDVLVRWVAADGLPWPPDPGPVARTIVADVDTVRAVGAGLAYGFRRGFVARVGCRSGFWRDHARAVTAAAPVERVVLSDLRPHPVANGWAWRAADSGVGGADNVPPADIFAHLPGRRSHTAVYPTRRAAEDALSTACLRYAAG